MNEKTCVFHGEKHEEVFIRAIQYNGEVYFDTKYGYSFSKNEDPLIPEDFDFVFEAAEDGTPSGMVITSAEWKRRDRRLNGTEEI